MGSFLRPNESAPLKKQSLRDRVQPPKKKPKVNRDIRLMFTELTKKPEALNVKKKDVITIEDYTLFVFSICSYCFFQTYKGIRGILIKRDPVTISTTSMKEVLIARIASANILLDCLIESQRGYLLSSVEQGPLHEVFKTKVCKKFHYRDPWCLRR